jgi:uncharacterized metal-binding protein YceD (DUF177 family)
MYGALLFPLLYVFLYICLALTGTCNRCNTMISSQITPRFLLQDLEPEAVETRASEEEEDEEEED